MQLSPLARKVWTVSGIVALTLLALALLWTAAGFLLLLFAGVLFAVFLEGISSWVADRTPLPYRGALLLWGIVLPAMIALGVWLLGPRLADQMTALWDRLPQLLSDLRDTLRDTGWGAPFANAIPETASLAPARWDVWGQVTGVASQALGILTNLFVVIFVGAYLAVAPRMYAEGFLRLVPDGRRERAGEVLGALGRALRKWLAGRLASMAVVAALTTGGLWVAGVPLALGLGILAGLLSFVPYVGPVVAAVPGILVAWGEGPSLALWAAGIYGAAQFLESWFITPLIQRGMVHVPPALLISAQVLLGVLVGALGVLLATPLLVAVTVVVQLLWVEDALGREPHLLGR